MQSNCLLPTSTADNGAVSRRHMPNHHVCCRNHQQVQSAPRQLPHTASASSAAKSGFATICQAGLLVTSVHHITNATGSRNRSTAPAASRCPPLSAAAATDNGSTSHVPTVASSARLASFLKNTLASLPEDPEPLAELDHEEHADLDEEALEGLVSFGTDPTDVAQLQEQLHNRRASDATASSSSHSRKETGSGGSRQGLQAARSSIGDRSAEAGSSLGAEVQTPRSRRRRQIPTSALPKVAIVGRPNVGKSALFNRLAGKAIAVVFDEPGVTRDRMYTRAFWGDKEYVIIDTGGLMSDASHLPLESNSAAVNSTSLAALPSAIERQAAAGVAEADAIILLADGQAGLQQGDREILAWLRITHPHKPVIVGINKCENANKADLQAAEFWELGVTPIALSALSGTGTGDLLDALMAALPPPTSLAEEDMNDEPLAVAIVGRPNVGKSSLLNAIVGEERAIVCDMSGTTRDAVDTTVTLPGGEKVTLIDTAGIRKKSKVAGSNDNTEAMSVDRAMRAVRRADVAVLVVDAAEGITAQDFRLSELFAGEGKAVVVVVNKWDLVDTKLWTTEKMVEDVKAQLRHVSWATVVCTSANKGRRVDDVVTALLAAGKEHRKRVTTATLNLVLKEATQWKAPPSLRNSGRKGKIYYVTQAGTGPPAFVFFVNDPKLIPDDYRRYMERALRDNIGFPGTPLRLMWRGKPARDKGDAGGKRSGADDRDNKPMGPVAAAAAGMQ